MTTKNLKKPEYLFEISWEVCNMVGGIYTVLSSKAKMQKEAFGDNYITIGPDVWKETHKNPYFIEDQSLFSEWRQQSALKGIKFKVGRWAIEGRPIAILIDFTPLFPEKDNIFARFWETYQLDSIHGPWDYVEPVMFGYAAGQVIESFYQYFLTGYDRVVAHFHEWMTGSGILYLKKYSPQIATVFTTHATYMGRSIAGNGLPLYQDLATYNPTVMANRFNITAQQSLEGLAAREADAFTTVSEITANECRQFLGRNPDAITINGFDPKIVGSIDQLPFKREIARKRILKVASVLTGSNLSDETTLVISSGRYEFKNKGIDLFIEALGELNKDKNLNNTIVGVIAVPANSAGPNKILRDCLANPDCVELPIPSFSTHFLHDAANDAVLNKIQQVGLTNDKDSKVKLVFIPVYLKGEDGIFDLHYYDFLTGFDLSVFPSYYEPWGYTPLESIAFGIPTITTSLAGFGIWVKELGLDGKSVIVVDRQEDNNREVIGELQQKMLSFASLSSKDRLPFTQQSFEIAGKAWWTELLQFYFQAWDVAITKLENRTDVFENKRFTETLRPLNLDKQDQPTWKKILFQPVYTKELEKLHKLAQNLWWSWNDDAISLFETLDPQAWQEVEHNPIHLMEGLSRKQMEAIEKDEEFVGRINKVYNRFLSYMEGASTSSNRIAYFSMEYGLHKSLKIYSGGLGILAGDYLKEASDSAVNLVGMGLLYYPANFKQDSSYPMIVYFYETHSENLFHHFAPKPSRSTINISDYTSRGYFVFTPDIKYRSPLPGQSAYDAIISGTQSMLERVPQIDVKRMGLQGQSWGGYQTAWLVTRTNLFKAAMAGAPVSNMTSAYGGIRWESGMIRAFQYEEGQSRIGATLWENQQAYIENSPLFYADRVETPLLIMSNDNDGAVPWYQGIEFFTALRRLNKPVWMLVYNNAPHNLSRRADSMDLTKRMQQFFDHYLKGEPCPEWMRTGLPALDKGRKTGF